MGKTVRCFQSELQWFTRIINVDNEYLLWQIPIPLQVEDQTNNRIKDLVSPDSLDGAVASVLVNAIYFKVHYVRTRKHTHENCN